jgi:crotonobetainyl-CoA:carnitine CoA-transferase CaiB-like acyl-CoA transferase
MTKVLEGVRVLEQGTFITGPAAGMLLGDLGADVVKIEQPGTGDPFRAFKGGLYSPHYQTYNRNKRSVTLNTKDAADLALFDTLVRDADVAAPWRRLFVSPAPERSAPVRAQGDE